MLFNILSKQFDLLYINIIYPEYALFPPQLKNLTILFYKETIFII